MTHSDLVNSVQFDLLGQLQIRIGARTLRPGGRRAQALLAALLLEAGRSVSVSRLAETVWGDATPRTALAQVRNRVSNLRQLLCAAGAPTNIVNKVGSGYAIDGSIAHRDVDTFENLVGEAERLRDCGARQAAADRLADALALWRGPALDGLHSTVLAAAANKLNERRLTIIEQHIDMRLDLGEHRSVVAELFERVAESPWRERLIGQLMLALYRDGRQRDALRQFELARGRLAAELGLDPSPDLVRLRDLILRNDSELEHRNGSHPRSQQIRSRQVTPRSLAIQPRVLRAQRRVPRTVPRELPPNVHGFTGHEAVFESLDELLADGSHDTGEEPILALITGPTGAGKTAIAVRWAHKVAALFPDGQLFVDLNGFGSVRPTPPAEALARLLASLRIAPKYIPHSESRASALYRSVLAGRRVLLMLDNARTAEQVRPLLPGDARCLVLITSRRYLAGLVARDGARRVSVEALKPAEAIELLGTLVGHDRTLAEPEATAELARRCAYLPLTLRTAAARLIGEPRRAIASYLAEEG